MPWLRNSLILTAVALVGLAVGGMIDSRKSIQPAAEETSQHTVHISLFSDRAEPDAVTIPVGSYLQFNSRDGRHTIAGSGELGPGVSHRVQFHEPGIFRLVDTQTPNIAVEVTVNEIFEQ